MAFVFQAKRNLLESQINNEDQIGPGYYFNKVVNDENPDENNNILSIYQRQHYAPFNSTEQRKSNLTSKEENLENQQNQILNLKPSVPGPGAYDPQVVENQQKDKYLIQTINKEIKVLEVPKMSSIFKSKTHRFHSASRKNVAPTPGPADYFQVNEKINRLYKFKQNQQQKYQQNRQLNITLNKIQTLIRQPTSSIPAKVKYLNDQGITQFSDKNSLNTQETNQDPCFFQNFKEFAENKNKNKVGPGYYNVKGQFSNAKKNNASPFFKSKVKRTFEELTQSSKENEIGPGKYNVTLNINPLYKYKESPCFQSNLERNVFFDVKRHKSAPRIQEKFNINSQKAFTKAKSQLKNLNPEQLQKYFEKLNAEQKQDFQQELIEIIQTEDANFMQENEYVKDAKPGPGHYHPENTNISYTKSSKPEQFQFFGSSSERFKYNLQKSVGPGQYNIRNNIGKDNTESKKDFEIAFNTLEDRFKLQFKEIENFPAPNAYKQKDFLQEKIVYKVLHGYKGNFGTTERRFYQYQQDQVNLNPGPGTYIDLEFKNQNKDDILNYYVKPSHQFISKSPRYQFINKRNITPPPGEYQLNQNDIATKLDKSNQDNADIEKPGFLSSDQRFKEYQKVVDQQNDENYKILLNENDKKEFFRQKKQNPQPFMVSEQRFKKLKNEQKSPSPQDYNQNQDYWNKKSYNIIFADDNDKIQILERKQIQYIPLKIKDND